MGWLICFRSVVSTIEISKYMLHRETKTNFLTLIYLQDEEDSSQSQGNHSARSSADSPV